MTINCKGNLIDVSEPKVMGVLNVTPNSFYDGGKYKTDSAILNRVEKMIIEGADFIDIGAYSSKPNASFVSENEECKRILPVVQLIINHFPDVLLSIDTFRSKVAEEAIFTGGAMINDISAGKADAKMLATVAKLQVPYCMMHMKGNPKTMQSLCSYDNLLKEIVFYFSEQLHKARSLGCNDILLDVGFGFSKTLEQNYTLLQNLDYFAMLELPLLVGISRKSMIYKLLKTSPQNALNGTTILNTIALQKGANILRVHDVKEAKECITIYNQLE